MTSRASLSVLSLFSVFAMPLFGETLDWPRWRGPADNGSTEAGGFPAKCDDTTLAWKVELPGKGCSTPIVVGKRIYLTAPAEGRDAALAYDWSGKLLWQTAFEAEVPGRHRNGSGSNPSPVSDGRGIFVAFKSGMLGALNLDGSVRWKINLVEKFGPVNLFWDFGSSPVLTEKNLVVARMHNGESWIAAFDKETGEMRWKTPRNYEVPREVDNGYTTPQVIRYEGEEALLSWGADHLTIHSSASGELLWSCSGFNPDATPLWPAVASPVLVGDTAVVCFGRADKGAPRLHGIKIGGRGDATSRAHLWKSEEVSSFVPSPASYKGLVYLLSDRGVVACVDPVKGGKVWSAELPKASANYYASPVIAGGLMYAAREDGTLIVAKVEGGFELLAENKLEDRVIAGVVPVGGRLIVRGNGGLYSFGK